MFTGVIPFGSKLGIGNWELGIGNWELGIGNRESQEPRATALASAIPHSPFTAYPTAAACRPAGSAPGATNTGRWRR
ncbi:hypothetical protein EIQ19_13465 [Xanthomonas campestris pv. campestris]